MRSSVMTAAAATLALTVAAFSSQALAGKPKKDLTDSGYTCVRVAVNFIECTKSGGTTYWCDDAGNCEAKPRTRPKAERAPNADVKEMDPKSGGKKGPAGVNKTVPPKVKAN